MPEGDVFRSNNTVFMCSAVHIVKTLNGLMLGGRVGVSRVSSTVCQPCGLAVAARLVPWQLLKCFMLKVHFILSTIQWCQVFGNVIAIEGVAEY